MTDIAIRANHLSKCYHIYKALNFFAYGSADSLMPDADYHVDITAMTSFANNQFYFLSVAISA
jgi:hypothetical protein